MDDEDFTNGDKKGLTPEMVQAFMAMKAEAQRVEMLKMAKEIENPGTATAESLVKTAEVLMKFVKGQGNGQETQT